MKRTVEKPQIIDDGKHTGIIESIEERTEPFCYIDFCIKVDDTNIILKASYPDKLMPNSKLGKVLSRFGAELDVGKEINLEALKGVKCQFVTISETTKNGTFAKIVGDSLKLA